MFPIVTTDFDEEKVLETIETQQSLHNAVSFRDIPKTKYYIKRDSSRVYIETIRRNIPVDIHSRLTSLNYTADLTGFVARDHAMKKSIASSIRSVFIIRFPMAKLTEAVSVKSLFDSPFKARARAFSALI